MQVLAKGPGPLRQGFSDGPVTKTAFLVALVVLVFFCFFPCKHHR